MSASPMGQSTAARLGALVRQARAFGLRADAPEVVRAELLAELISDGFLSVGSLVAHGREGLLEEVDLALREAIDRRNPAERRQQVADAVRSYVAAGVEGDRPSSPWAPADLQGGPPVEFVTGYAAPG